MKRKILAFSFLLLFCFSSFCLSAFALPIYVSQSSRYPAGDYFVGDYGEYIVTGNWYLLGDAPYGNTSVTSTIADFTVDLTLGYWEPTSDVVINNITFKRYAVALQFDTDFSFQGEDFSWMIIYSYASSGSYVGNIYSILFGNGIYGEEGNVFASFYHVEVPQNIRNSGIVFSSDPGASIISIGSELLQHEAIKMLFGDPRHGTSEVSHYGIFVPAGYTSGNGPPVIEGGTAGGGSGGGTGSGSASSAFSMFFGFIADAFQQLLDISFFGGFVTLGGLILVPLAFAIVKLFLKYFAGG